MKSNLSKSDVNSVADQLHIELTEAQIEKILLLYPAWQDDDPTGTWNLVIENLIYHITDTFIL